MNFISNKWLFMPSLLLFFVIILTSEANAQCCAAGNPVNSNCSLTNGFNNIFNITLNQVYSVSNTYFDGSKRLDKQYAKINFNFSSLALSYGLTEKLKLTCDLGFFINKSQHFNQFISSTDDTIPETTKKAQGIADGSLGFVYQTYHSDDDLFNFMQSLRITLPIGAFNQADAVGNVLPIDLQPSSGNSRVNLGFIMSKKFENNSLSLISAGNVEFSQMIETPNTYQKYGNLYNLSLSGLYNITPDFLFILQTRCEVRDKALNGAKSQKNQFSYLNSSGGIVYFLSPQFSFSTNSWMFSLQYNQPVYKKVYGEQLTNNYSVFATISRSFNFAANDLMQKSEIFKDSLIKSISITVKGNCEMCKSRIEETVNNAKFVESSDWNIESKTLTIYYKNGIPDINEIEMAISKVGHDTEKYKAEDIVYDKLPKCCHYRLK